MQETRKYACMQESGCESLVPLCVGRSVRYRTVAYRATKLSSEGSYSPAAAAETAKGGTVGNCRVSGVGRACFIETNGWIWDRGFVDGLVGLRRASTCAVSGAAFEWALARDTDSCNCRYEGGDMRFYAEGLRAEEKARHSMGRAGCGEGDGWGCFARDAEGVRPRSE